MAWGLWSRRKIMNYEGKYQEPFTAIECGLAITRSYQDSLHTGTTTVVRSCKWTTPNAGFLKPNVYGTIFFDLEKSGFGCIARNHMGEVIMAAR